MTRDINAYLRAEEAKTNDAIAKMFGSSVAFEDLATAAQDLFPREVRELHALGVFYEGEMFRCRDAKAYFFGCLAGAAMIESYLLLFSIFDRSQVEKTATFQKMQKSTRTYEETVLGWTLKQLIPITQELGWIRHDIQSTAISVLLELYRDLAPVVRPGITTAEIDASSIYLEKHPDLALLHLMQSMRNLIHGGRCVRLSKKLYTDDFAEWAQLVMVLTVEVRDCLILKLKSVSQKYLIGLLNSPDGLASVIELITLIRAKGGAKPARQGR